MYIYIYIYIIYIYIYPPARFVVYFFSSWLRKSSQPTAYKLISNCICEPKTKIVDLQFGVRTFAIQIANVFAISRRIIKMYDSYNSSKDRSYTCVSAGDYSCMCVQAKFENYATEGLEVC